MMILLQMKDSDDGQDLGLIEVPEPIVEQVISYLNEQAIIAVKQKPVRVITLNEIKGINTNRSRCSRCGSPSIKPNDFRDALSRMEFSTSRMCQACQDTTKG